MTIISFDAEHPHRTPVAHALIEYGRNSNGAGSYDRTHARLRVCDGVCVLDVTDDSPIGSLGWRAVGDVESIIAAALDAARGTK